MSLVLGPGDYSPAISEAKLILGVIPVTPEWSEDLEVRVRGFQIQRGLDPTGYLEEEVIEELFANRTA